LGQWLKVCTEKRAIVAGIDISEKAVDICKQDLPDAEFFATPAESLPFASERFDTVTCLGSLEHFVDPVGSIREMIRVAKSSAIIVLLVPNADFLTRKLGLFSGTQQIEAKEEVRTLEEWNCLFETAGLIVERRWKDLHVLSWQWISLGKWYQLPFRAIQASLLALWPLKWQYQVYHLCRIKNK
jgi:SAM-dependent methyltransferase